MHRVCINRQMQTISIIYSIKNMKIAYCIPQISHPGGIERVIIHKANYLAEKLNYDVCIITVDNKDSLPYYSLSAKIKHIDLNINYCDTLSLPLHKRFIIRKVLQQKHKKSLKNFLLNNKFDIVISTFQQEASFLYKIKDGSKKLLECHFCKGYKSIIAKYYNYSILTKIAYRYKSWYDEYFIPNHYDKMIVLTEEDFKNWEHNTSNLVCIPNPLSFTTNQTAKLDNKTVIAVGRYDAQKGFDRLLYIWRTVIDKCPEWHLNLYGQGEDEKLLLEIIKKLSLSKYVTLHPPYNNIKEKFLESSIAVMPSRFEGFGLVLTEAMECGLPCVAFAFPCGAKDIIKNKSDGFYIENNNNEEFAKKLILLMTNSKLRKNFGKQAKINVQRFSDEIIMNKWNNLFIEILK